MAIALASRPEVIITGTVLTSRQITRKDDRTQVLGTGYTVSAANGDRLAVTAWARDAPQLVGLGIGEQFAAIGFPSGEDLNLLRPVDAKDLDALASIVGA